MIKNNSSFITPFFIKFNIYVITSFGCYNINVKLIAGYNTPHKKGGFYACDTSNRRHVF